LPKVTSPVSIKVYKALAKPYDTVAATFVAGDGERLKAEVEFGQSIWRMVGYFYPFYFCSLQINSVYLIRIKMLVFFNKSFSHFANNLFFDSAQHLQRSPQ